MVVKGSLVNFKGNTPEMAKKNQLVSYDGETVPDTPDKPDTPDNPEPGVPGDPVAVDPIKIPHGTENATGAVAGSYTIDDFTITIEKSSGTTPPAINVYNGVGTLRAYADNTVTISGPAMAKIVFELNTATGSKQYTTFTPNVGSVGTQASGDASITWTGNNDSVTFTVGHDATLGTDSGKRGQVHISKIEIYPAK